MKNLISIEKIEAQADEGMVELHGADIWMTDIYRLQNLLRKRHPKEKIAGFVPTEEIEKKICRLAISFPGFPGVVEYFLIAGLADGHCVFTVSVDP